MCMCIIYTYIFIYIMHSHTHTDKPVTLAHADALAAAKFPFIYLFSSTMRWPANLSNFFSSEDFSSNVFTLKVKLLTVQIYQKLTCLLTHRTQTRQWRC